MATPDEVGASLTNLQTTADQARAQLSSAPATPEDLDRLRDQTDAATSGLAEWLTGALAPADTGKKK